ncbi:MAG TPA: hypothetical protein VFN57_15975 [Thermomicrobiaceae bacterium]|nr:hypothetical protein [Thermomicrobiaceae bacterium]
MTDEWRPEQWSGGPDAPVVIGVAVTQLGANDWVASAVVLADPAGQGPSRHVVARGASREEARRALMREIAALGDEPLPDTRVPRAG